jgi:PAS domain S-box-containing protein
VTHVGEPDDELRSDFFSLVVRNLPEAVIVTRPDGVITYVNSTTESLLGYSSEELIGQPMRKLVPPDPSRRADPVKWLAKWAAASDLEQSRFLELTARRCDGTDLTAEVRVREGPIEGQQRYFITVRDNTERRLAQIALKDANLRAERLLLVAADATVTIDSDHRIIFFNPAAERMFGFNVDEVIGQPLSILIPSQFRDDHDSQVHSFAQSKSPSRLMSERAEVQGQRRNGDVFPLEATITRVSAGGRLTFTAQLRDVTERNRTKAELIERERRIRAVFDNSREAIVLLDPNGRIVEANRSAHTLTTLGQAEIGRPIWETAWLGGQNAPGPGGALEQAVRKAEAGVGGILTIDRAAQRARLSITITPIPGQDETIQYILVEAGETQVP